MPYRQSLPVPFSRNAYESRSRPLSSQRLVNLYAEAAPEDGKSPIVLYGTPGQITFGAQSTIDTELGEPLKTEDGDALLLESSLPVYGMHVMGSTLFVVTGGQVSIMDSAGRFESIGDIGLNSSFVQMEDNGTETVILKSDGTAYIATTTSVTEITDPDYQLASSVTVMDGYHIFSKQKSGQFFISGLNDAANYDALDFATAEGRADDIVRVFADHRELWIFGKETIEVWYNSGNKDFPFERIQGAFIERGCAAKLSVAKEANTLYWLGDDLIIYQARQYLPERISTHAIEKALLEKDNIEDAVSFIYTQEGHKFYILTFPASGGTFVYDIATGLWHERESFDKNIWRACTHAFAFGKNLVGDCEVGLVSELVLDVYQENGETIRRIAQSPNMFAGNNRFIIDMLRIDLDAGVGLVGDHSLALDGDAIAMLSWSDDGGHTFSNERFASFGKVGEYKNRLVWRALGQSRQRMFRITITDPVKVAILGAYVDVRTGRP